MPYSMRKKEKKKKKKKKEWVNRIVRGRLFGGPSSFKKSHI